MSVLVTVTVYYNVNNLLYTGECGPCFEECGSQGCAGPLPYVNSSAGCISCNTIIVNRQGEQVLIVLSWGLLVYDLLSRLSVGDRPISVLMATMKCN